MEYYAMIKIVVAIAAWKDFHEDMMNEKSEKQRKEYNIISICKATTKI